MSVVGKMILLVWNAQDIGFADTVNALFGANHDHRPDIICLLETKAKRKRAARLCRWLEFSEFFVVNPVGVAELSGSMMVMWHNRLVVSSSFYSDSTIDMLIDGIGRFTFVFGVRDEKLTYERYVVGDCYFNKMLNSDAKEGGCEFGFRRSRKLREFINECGVMDTKPKGCFYTWRNGGEKGVFYSG